MSEIVTLSYYGRTYRMHNPGAGRIGSKLSMGTVYERPLLVDVKNRNLAGQALDIGAHIGNHSLWFSVVCGLEVHAIEPHPDSLPQLRANLDLNPHADITVHEWAAADRHTYGRFTPGYWVEFDPTRNGAKMKVERGDIACHPIDDMLDLPDLSLVKADIEGMEEQALAGLVRHLERTLPIVYCEAHTAADIEGQRRVLGPLGYRLTKKIKMGSRVVVWEA